jgi:hypothetical protein
MSVAPIIAANAPGVTTPTVGLTPVQVVSLTYNDGNFWHQNIQPVIDNLPDRLDNGWNWAVMPFWLALVERLRGRELVGYAIMCPSGNGKGVPVGLALLSCGYPALDDPRHGSVYVWYVATAPAQALVQHGIAARPPLLEALVDIAMVESEARGFDGRIGLHAANRGNSPSSRKLHQAYRSRCGLIPVPPTAQLPGVRRGRNDGRYFYASPAVASARMAALDCFR